MANDRENLQFGEEARAMKHLNLELERLEQRIAPTTLGLDLGVAVGVGVGVNGDASGTYDGSDSGSGSGSSGSKSSKSS
jgi:hypothetical protein